MRLHTQLALGVLLAEAVLGVKHHDFKTCSQSGFCRRGRALAQRAAEAGASNWKSPYSLDTSKFMTSSDFSTVTVPVKSSIHPNIKFEVSVTVHEDGGARIRMDEVDGLRKRYDGAADWALISNPVPRAVKWKRRDDAVEGSWDDVTLRIQFEPLLIELTRNGKVEMSLNGRGLLHMEHFREKLPEKLEEKTEENTEDVEGAQGEQVVIKEPDVKPNAWFEGETEDAFWEETFGSWTDSKPKGPESFSIDINFPSHPHVYGIPQHAAPLDLPTTTGENAFFSDPYRLYNLDVFEYEASSTMSLYGSIPLLHAHNEKSTLGVFVAVGSETWIDIARTPDKEGTNTHWVAESGILDLVQKRFDEADMPVDVFWLDIEYAKDHMYFMWDEKTFPDPVEMTKDVVAVGRKMVVIVDPHLKRTSSYPAYKAAQELNVLVKRPGGKEEFEGWCWSGSSAWVDFFDPGSWEWWKGLYKFDKPKTIGDGQEEKALDWAWRDSSEGIHIWNDMNEPSVFNGPEITMQKDNVHYGGWEHRDVHNINGMLYHNITAQALKARSDPAKRPFVLTRSFFAGSQRHGAMWTGDNLGTWEHMAVGVKMVLANGIAGMTFAGADVGGFFGNPPPDMLVRWYQVGAFAPFFRAHAHIDTKRREPYLLEEPYRGMVRDILRLRYSMLPIWYTAFRETSVTGLPVLRPHYVMFPKDKQGFSIDDQYYIGNSGLLIKPVTDPGVEKTEVYLAEAQPYYDYASYDLYHGSEPGHNVTVPAPLEKIPILVRGGSFITTRERPRRSSPLMKHDPVTLLVALDKEGVTRTKRPLHLAQFYAETAKQGLVIASEDLAADNLDRAVDQVVLERYDADNAFAREMAHVRIERIVVLGLKKAPKVIRNEGIEIEFTWEAGEAADGKKDGKASVLVIKNPGAFVAKKWGFLVEF
ncbi:glycoside hydrolase family 31 protein [Ceratobasidium sp. AG-Ba]|nr:glycoside hydrolase family 31 protein [Ceratobasidium sp. AG-Ba]